MITKDSDSPNEDDAFERFTLPLPLKQVYRCENGHIYCSECKPIKKTSEVESDLNNVDIGQIRLFTFLTVSF